MNTGCPCQSCVTRLQGYKSGRPRSPAHTCTSLIPAVDEGPTHVIMLSTA